MQPLLAQQAAGEWPCCNVEGHRRLHHAEQGQQARDGTVDRSTFYRGSQYQTVESVTTPDEKTVVVKFSSPNLFFLDTLAGSYAKVQAPEAIDAFEQQYNKLQAEHIIGTGPFELAEFKAEGTLNHRRFEKFPSPAHLDGIRYLPLFDQAARPGGLRAETDRRVHASEEGGAGRSAERFEKQMTNNITFSANGGLVLTNGEGFAWNIPS